MSLYNIVSHEKYYCYTRVQKEAEGIQFRFTCELDEHDVLVICNHLPEELQQAAAILETKNIIKQSK